MRGPLVAAILAIVCTGCRSDHTTTVKPAERQPVSPASRGPKPVIASARHLRMLSSEGGYPLYWAGRKDRFRYELTRGQSYTFVRYLPAGVHAGSRKSEYLTIGSYPRPDALRSLVTKAARNPRYATVRLSHGGRAIYAKNRPTLIYVAYPRSRVQVEVFHPSARVARDLVVRGRIRRID